MPALGVNIDHVATLRQARGGAEPEPLMAAMAAQLGGADGITIHLREDRRHIQDRDLRLLREAVQVKLNLEMAATDEMTKIALATKVDMCTLVPEKRRELTTEGGLDVSGNLKALKKCISALRRGGIAVSLFVDPDLEQIRASADAGAQYIEIHTGCYANARGGKASGEELLKIIRAAECGRELNLGVNAGHGLNYLNVREIAVIPGMEELNIGHSIVSRAVFVGLERAVREMKDLLRT